MSPYSTILPEYITATWSQKWRDAKVVGDEDEGEVELVAQLGEQVHHLRLDRHVEGRDRLVGDDQLRLDREGAGDADALAAGELRQVAVDVLGVEADELEQLLDPGLLLAVVQAVDLERRREDGTDGSGVG